jgi:hypothetical protein
MTIDELKKSMDIHFHDAEICSVCIDYVHEEASFLINVDLSDPEREVAPSSRLGYLKLTGLLYCVIDSPGARDWSGEYIPSDSRLWITGDSSDYSVLKNPPPLPYPLAENSFRHFFYNSNDYNFIYVAAMDAHWNWKD